MATAYPISQDLVLVQGSRLVASIAWSPTETVVDFSTYTVKSEIWAGRTLVLDLTPHWTKAVGQFNLFVPATVTDDVTKGGTWDFLLWPTGSPDQALRLYSGRVTFVKGVTDLDGTAPGVS